MRALCLLLLGGGCVWKRGIDSSPVDDASQSIDSLYQQRISKERLVESIDIAEQMAIKYPQNPEVQWRVARGITALAYGFPTDESERLLLEAMEWGRECLRANPGWTSRENLSGGRVTRRAALRLSKEDLPCLEALLTAWTRWIVLRGAAAHVDLAQLEILAIRGNELDVEDYGWVAPWALGMAVGLSTRSADRSQEYATLLELAASREPELATPRIDALYIDTLRGERREGRSEWDTTVPIHAAHPWSLENRRAVQRELQLRDSELPSNL